MFTAGVKLMELDSSSRLLIPKDLKKYGPHASWPLYNDNDKHNPIDDSGHFIIITDPMQPSNKSLLIDKNETPVEFSKKTNPRGMKLQEYLKGDYLFLNFDIVWNKLLSLYNEKPEWFKANNTHIGKKKNIKIKKQLSSWKDCDNKEIQAKMVDFS